MNGPDGLVVILPPEVDGRPLWLKIVDGRIVSRSASAALAGMEGDGVSSREQPVMLVVPQAVVTMRRLDLPSADMTMAQARSVATRLAREASIGEADGLHAVTCVNDPQNVAIIARDDIAHFIAWGRHQGVEAGIIIPSGMLLPEPEEGVVAARIGDQEVVRGQDFIADCGPEWVRQLIGDAPMRMLGQSEVDDALVDALAHPPLNLRSGEFALPRTSGIEADMLKRMAIWVGFIALAALLVSLVLIARYHISAAQLDARTVEVARPLLPAANDAVLVAGEIDRMLNQRGGGGYGFTGPVAGLMTAMQSVPGVSLTALSLEDDGLVHATLSSARADDINAVLLGVQAAGFRITATSSADPGGRMTAQITVMP